LTRLRLAPKIEIRLEVIMLAYAFIIFAIAFRFMPHPLAFTPVAAALLYFGAKGPRHKWIPFVLLAASDVFLTTMFYKYPFSWDHFVTWACYAGMLWLGSTLRKNGGAVRVMGSAVVASVSFFVISNFAVWAAWEMYPRTFAGLMTCYDAGLPFFRRAFEGDLLFTAAMFGLPVLAHMLAEKFSGSADHTAAA
jgi:hypothetical protein